MKENIFINRNIITENAWITQKHYLQIMICLFYHLGEENYIKYNQAKLSVKEIAKFTSIKETTVEEEIKELINMGKIETETINGETVYTILNANEYLDLEDDDQND